MLTSEYLATICSPLRSLPRAPHRRACNGRTSSPRLGQPLIGLSGGQSSVLFYCKNCNCRRCKARLRNFNNSVACSDRTSPNFAPQLTSIHLKRSKCEQERVQILAPSAPTTLRKIAFRLLKL